MGAVRSNRYSSSANDPHIHYNRCRNCLHHGIFCAISLQVTLREGTSHSSPVCPVSKLCLMRTERAYLFNSQYPNDVDTIMPYTLQFILLMFSSTTLKGQTHAKFSTRFVHSLQKACRALCRSKQRFYSARLQRISANFRVDFVGV